MSGEVANTGGDGGDLQNLDDCHVRHRVDRVEQHQVECVDDGRAREHVVKEECEIIRTVSPLTESDWKDEEEVKDGSAARELGQTVSK